MADNNVVIKLDMDTTSAENSLTELSNHVDKALQNHDSSAIKNLALQIKSTISNVSKLKSELDKVSNTFVPTDEYKKLGNQVELASAKLEQMVESQQRYLREAGFSGADVSYERVLQGILNTGKGQELDKTLTDASMSMEKLENEGKAFHIDTKSVDALTEKLTNAENKLVVLKAKLDESVSGDNTRRNREADATIAKVERILAARRKEIEAQKKSAEGAAKREAYERSIEGRARRVASTMRTWYIIQREISKTTNVVKNAYNKLSGVVKKILSSMTRLHKSTERHNTSANDGFRSLLRNVLRYGLGIRSLYFLFRRLRSVGVEAIKELVKVSDDANASVSRVVQAFNGMKGSIVSIIQPLISIFAPALEKILNLITKIVTAFGTFFAMLTGQSFMYTATANTVDYAASLDKTGSSAKKAKKELEGYLSPIDEINKYKKDDDSSSGSGDDVGYTLQKTPIDTDSMLADWINKFINPLKKAWAKVGDFVKDAWAGAFKSLKQLGIDVINDFLEVWNQQKTIEMLETILRIFGRIGTLVDILATKFDIAWRTNEVGKRILENIRDIFAIIVDHIDSALAKTQTWAMELNFTPLLEAVATWLDSLKPVVDGIMSVFESFYTTVLLPLAEWGIEEGLPELLNVFSQLNEQLSNSGLAEKLQTLWEHLEPFAETVGEGLIQFVGEISTKLAEFVESEAFNNFLTEFEIWMDNVTADDVVNTMWNVINALVGLKLAILGFEAISTAVTVIGTIQKFIAFFGAGTTATTAAESMTAVGGGMSALAAGFSALIGLGGGFFLGSMLKEVIFDAAKWSEAKKGADENVEALEHVHEKYKGLNGTVKMLKDAFRGFPTEIEQVTDETGKVTKTINQFGHTIIEVNDGVSVSIEHESDTVETETVKMQTAYSDTQENVSLEMKTLTKNMDDTTTSMKNSADLMKSSFSADKWTLSGVADGLAKTFNSAIERVKGIWNTFADWLNSKLQIKLDTTSMIGGGLSKVLGTSTINLGSIPKLATGAVIPPNKEFMAVLGDQKNGTNIETPLSTMVEAFNQALNQNGGGKTEINFLLPNKQKVAQYVIEGGRVLQMSKGRNPFELA